MAVDKKVCIATARPVGELCKKWAKENTPQGFSLTDDIEASDIIISVKYDKILSKETVEKKQCFNFHPAPLPKYRGVGLASWFIINREKISGVSLHKIDEGIDTGPIIEIREFLINESDTAQVVFNQSEKIILEMFQDWYNNLLNGKFSLKPQDVKNQKLYLEKDLQKEKDLTRYARAFHFKGKESAYYYNSIGEKIYLKY
tara:strand:- start:329 stop:931 length:603 start_codon:yes stop_codon:yes gene_type:complete